MALNLADPNGPTKTGLPTREAMPVGGSSNAYALGNVAANRQAYQPGFDQANRARGAETDSLSMARAAAQGNAPSQAQILGRNMIGQSLQTQLGAAASARGGPMAQAAAMRQAQQGAASFQQQGMNNLDALRAQEMATARDQYGQQAATLRQGDMGQAALMSQNENAQRQLNQVGQLGFNDQAIGIDKSNAQNGVQQYAIDSQNWQTAANNAATRQRQESDISQHSQDRESNFIGGLIGGGAATGASIVGSLFGSDERMKQAAPKRSISHTSAVTGGIEAGADAFAKSLGNAANYYPTNGHIGNDALLRSDERMKLLMPMNHVDPGTGTVQLHDGGISGSDLLQAGTGLAGAQPVHGMVGGGGITGGSVNLGSAGAGGGSGHGMMYSDARAKQAAYNEGHSDALEHLAKAQGHDRSAQEFLTDPLGGVALTYGAPGGAPQVLMMAPKLVDAAWSKVDAAHERSKVKPEAMLTPMPAESGSAHMAEGAARAGLGVEPSLASQAAGEGRAIVLGERGVSAYVPSSPPVHEESTSPGLLARVGNYIRSDENSKRPHMADVAMMADANRQLKPSAYEYKPEYTPPDQAPGEVNVGPMAQNMASNPLSATAVKRGPDGMLMVDKDKALRLALGSIGALQLQLDHLKRGKK